MNDNELKVLDLRRKGYTYGQICKELGLTKSLVAYYAKRSTIEAYHKRNEQKNKVQQEYEDLVCKNVARVANINELCKIMGKRSTNNNYLHFKQIIEKYNLDTSHFSYSPIVKKSNHYNDEEYFILDRSKLKASSHVKKRILQHKIKDHKCECCGNALWNGKEIPLELHHVNGDRFDNRLENLQLLCPNCHAQTDNYAGKNKIKKEQKDKIQYFQIDIKKPSAEELIIDYKELGSFLQIGKKYNVSDNTIKHWFKKYNLPSDVFSIRKYIIDRFGEQPQWYAYMYDENGNRKNMKYKKIDAYTEDNIFLKTYNNANEVIKDLNLKCASAVRSVCNGNRKHYSKYIFKYHEE